MNILTGVVYHWIQRISFVGKQQEVQCPTFAKHIKETANKMQLSKRVKANKIVLCCLTNSEAPNMKVGSTVMICVL